MRNMPALCLSALAFAGMMSVTASFAADNSGFGVTRTEIEGIDNWAWNDTPISPSALSCPGGELVIDELIGPYCDSNTGRLHFRGGSSWSCISSNDPRMSGVSVYTSNGNFDANACGPVWGTWKVVPMENCDKDGSYPEELVMNATSFWEGTWSGRRQFYSINGFNVWISDLKAVIKGSGGDLDGLHFSGSELITTYTASPVPYEFLPPELGLFNEPEAVFSGVIIE